MKSDRLIAKDCLELLWLVFQDGWSKCSADVVDLRDWKTIQSRVKHEGISFLTITLPSFSQMFERCLHDGIVGPASFNGWETVKGGRIPVFLQGIVGQVFDLTTGELHDDYPHDTNVGGTSRCLSPLVEFVRQLCCTFKKVELDCTPERVTAAFEGFLATEQSFDDFSCTADETAEFLAVSDLLWHNAFADFDVQQIVPRHGPGATAERVSGNQKFHWQFWFDRLEPYFPLVGSAYPMGVQIRHSENLAIPEWEVSDAEELQHITVIPRGSEFPVRVVQVPKTLKGPRIIAIEPACMQYAQQGIRDYLYDRLESYWLTKGHVNFRDQQVNQTLALDASRTGRLATIDLKDASDRVPLSFSSYMFRSHPDLWGAIEACRSDFARLPGGEEVFPLRKFASMGSALCFPVEAMYFYTILVLASLKKRKLSITPANAFLVTRDIFVYGDDLIVPAEEADFVLEHLQKYNCKVNRSKSFWTGKFRESCGVDAYNGDDVTPVYVRHLRPEDKQQAERLISWTKTANQLYKKGYWRSSFHMWKCVEDHLGNLPFVDEEDGVLGRYSFLGYPSLGIADPLVRWNKHLHVFEKKMWVPGPVRRTDVLEGYGALAMSLQGLASHEAGPHEGIDLSSSARHGAVALKLRWAPIRNGQSR